MGYATGSAANPGDIIAAIFAACAADGWTVSGNVVSKGGCYTRITSPTSTTVKIEGANDSGFTDVCPWAGYIALNAWPVSYRIWTNTDPDACFVHVCQADHVTYQYMTFGEIEDKVGDWVGGNFFAATRNIQTSTDFTEVAIYSGTSVGGSLFANMAAAPFMGGTSQNSFLPGGQGMHIEINGGVWADGSTDTTATTDHVYWPTFQNPINYRQPNLWNGQAVLLRPHLYVTRPAGRFSKIGSLPHMRALRITNYEPYDIITLGEDQWMVAPWSKKDTVNIDGQTSGGSSGTHGFAIKYTP